MRILIVRMSSLGDIVHALPVLSAIRAAQPASEVDWLADRKYAGVLEFVDGLTQVIIGRPGLGRAVARMRQRRYDVACDLQGLLKSAAMARFSGARRVVGFERDALRERSAAWFYGESAPVPPRAHIVQKNLAVLPLLGIDPPAVPAFALRVPPSPAADRISADVEAHGRGGFAAINPGAAWPNKRWPPERFGAVAAHLLQRHGLASYVLWGPGEGLLADGVVAASRGAAIRAPHTNLGDLIAIVARARLMISGDTGPVHIAAALGTPIVGLYGPTWPERNGPWHADDVVVSRAESCECHHERRCRRLGAGASGARMCLDDITVEEVAAAVDRRLARVGTRPA